VEKDIATYKEHGIHFPDNLLVSHLHAGCAGLAAAEAVFAALYVQKLAARDDTSSAERSIVDVVPYEMARRALLELVPLSAKEDPKVVSSYMAQPGSKGGRGNRPYKSTASKKCKNCQGSYHGNCHRPAKCRICSSAHHTREHGKATSKSITKGRRTCWHCGKDNVKHFSAECHGSCSKCAGKHPGEACAKKRTFKVDKKRKVSPPGSDGDDSDPGAYTVYTFGVFKKRTEVFNAIKTGKFGIPGFTMNTKHGLDILDCATTYHMAGAKARLTDIVSIPPLCVKGWAGKGVVTHQGTMSLRTVGDDHQRSITTLSKAMISPSLGPVNLVAVGPLVASGLELHLDNIHGELYSRHQGEVKVIIRARKIMNGMWLCNPLIAILPRRMSDKDPDRDPASRSPTCFFPGRVKGVSSPMTIDFPLYHLRQSHAGESALRRLANATGVTLVGSLRPCDACSKGGLRRTPYYRSSAQQHYKRGECWSLDAEGRFRVQTLGGKYYCLFAVEDHHGYVRITMLRTKDEQWGCLETLLAWSEAQTGHRVKAIRVDGEWEKPQAVKDLQAKHGFEMLLTHPATPNENGLAEVTGGILMRRAAILLVQARLPHSFLGYALSVAAYTYNLQLGRAGRVRAEGFYNRKVTHHQLRVFGCLGYGYISAYKPTQKGWPGIFVGYGAKRRGWDLLLFGGKYKGQIRNFRTVKWHEHVRGMDYRKAIADQPPLGYVPERIKLHGRSNDWFELPSTEPTGTSAWTPPPRLTGGQMFSMADYDGIQDHGKFVATPSVASSSHDSPQDHGLNVVAPDATSPSHDPSQDQGQIVASPSQDELSVASSPLDTGNALGEHPTLDMSFSHAGTAETDTISGRVHRRHASLPTTGHITLPPDPSRVSTRSRTRGAGVILKYTKNWAGWDSKSSATIPPNPLTHLAACFLSSVVDQSTDTAWSNDRWRAAMKTHVANLISMDVFELTGLPQGKVAIGARWVFAIKGEELPKLQQVFKARWVAKGFMQQYGRDYQSTWSPTVRLFSLHFLLSIAARDARQIEGFDVKDAYLRASLAEELYVKAPPHFQEGVKTVWRLKKALPGLKQSGRAWYHLINKILKKMGFTPTHLDPCVFVKLTKGRPLYVAIHVDDGLFIYDTPKQKHWFIAELKKHFGVTTFGFPMTFLGVNLHRYPDGSILLHQTDYIKKLLHVTGFTDCAGKVTPAVIRPDLHGGGPSSTRARRSTKSLRSINGSILWISRNARPDVAYASAKIAQHVDSEDTETEWRRVGRVLRYLRHRLRFGILFKTGYTGDPDGYTDSDFGGAKDRHSQGGYLFTLGDAPVAWGSWKQKTIALNTAEAELSGLTEAAKQTLAIITFLREIKEAPTLPFRLRIDNTATKTVAETSVFSKGLKHVQIKHAFTTHLINKGVIKLEYVASEDNLADMLTKPLLRVALQKTVEKLMHPVPEGI
jgi:hypothetical protein